jgi:pectinesterase
MKRSTWSIAATLAIVATPGSAQVAEPLHSGDRLTVRATNALPFERRAETISIPWADLTGRLRGVTGTAVRVVDGTGREIVSQVFDANADGTPDALLFQSDFQPRESLSLIVEARAPGKAAARVHVRHDDPRDDMAWENDLVAFRIYGEGLKKTPSAMSSNGIDVWLKRTRDLIVEKWYAKGHDAYHVDLGEGADFFDVGQTLGVGGTALWRGDTIQRGDNFKAWKIIANGPIRSVFELRYDPWGDSQLRVSEVKRISIDAGQHLYRAESVFRVEGSNAQQLAYATGVVKRPGMIATMSKTHPWAWVTGWGPVARKNGGHGELGTAVIIQRERLTDWKETDNHYLGIARATSGQPVTHYVGAAWTAAGDITSPQSWWAYLDQFAQRLASPISVTLGSRQQ